jgi:putative ATPase
MLPPLAERLRPHTLAQVVGQAHLLAPDQPLGMAYAAKRLHSMILWGPPGVGKTTLARLLAAAVDLPFIALSAVLAGVKDIRDAVDQARGVQALSRDAQAGGKPTVVFVDEVHRFNKSQQDAFLPHVESGLFIFIGATTENPSFEVNAALLSRAAVYVLQPLSEDDLALLVQRGLAESGSHLRFDDDALAMLLRSADGDGRRLLNHLEAVIQSSAAGAKLASGVLAAAAGVAKDAADGVVSVADLSRILSQALRRFDKGGEAFYDQISALHKSVRGSDPDGALYWFCRMIDGGVDVRYLARRMIRMASEDIGLADPRALQICLNAADTYERLGSPEGELTLAQAVIYLAVAAKSNAVYTAYKAAMKTVKEHGSAPVPIHLRNAPTKLMKQLGYGEQYRYSHDEPHAFSAGQTYLPDGMNVQFYKPTDRGLEAKIGEKLAFLKRLDASKQ